MSGPEVPLPVPLDEKQPDQAEAAAPAPAAGGEEKEGGGGGECKQEGGSGASGAGGGGERRTPGKGPAPKRGQHAPKGGRHLVEVPANAEREVGVVVSHQEKVRRACLLQSCAQAPRCLRPAAACSQPAGRPWAAASAAAAVGRRGCMHCRPPSAHAHDAQAVLTHTSTHSPASQAAHAFAACTCAAPPALPAPQYGFIKASSREARYFFHVNDTDGSTAPK